MMWNIMQFILKDIFEDMVELTPIAKKYKVSLHLQWMTIP